MSEGQHNSLAATRQPWRRRQPVAGLRRPAGPGAPRTAVQHLDQAAGGPGLRRLLQGHDLRGQPLQARLGAGPVRRPDRRLLEKLYGQPVQLELALAPREAYVPGLTPRPPRPRPTRRRRSRPTSSDDAATAAFKNRLNTALTFDTLVEGTANRMARAAAMHVSGMPGHLYNPLVHLRRRRPGQDPPDARGGQPAAGRPARQPKFSTSTPSSSSRMWSRPISARLSTSSRSVTTRSICC